MFVRNFNITLVETRKLEIDATIQYVRTLVNGGLLHQFDLLSTDVLKPETLNVGYYIKGLVFSFPPVTSISKQIRAMRRRLKRNAQSRSKILCGVLD